MTKQTTTHYTVYVKWAYPCVSYELPKKSKTMAEALIYGVRFITDKEKVYFERGCGCTLEIWEDSAERVHCVQTCVLRGEDIADC